jgi:hypothetical protein
LNQFWFFHVVCLFQFASRKIIKNDCVESKFRQKIFEIYIDIDSPVLRRFDGDSANSFRNARDALRARRDIEEIDTAMRFDGGRWSVLGDADEVRKSDERRKIGAAVKQAIADLTGMKAVNVRVLPGNGS